MSDRPWGNQPTTTAPTRDASADVLEDLLVEERLQSGVAELDWRKLGKWMGDG